MENVCIHDFVVLVLKDRMIQCIMLIKGSQVCIDFPMHGWLPEQNNLFWFLLPVCLTLDKICGSTMITSPTSSHLWTDFTCKESGRIISCLTSRKYIPT